MFRKYEKTSFKKYMFKTSTDVSDVDVLPQWEQIHISLEAEFL